MEEHKCNCGSCDCGSEQSHDCAEETIVEEGFAIEESPPVIEKTEDGLELDPEYVRLQELKDKRRKLRNMRKKAKQLGCEAVGTKRGRRFMRQLFGGSYA